MKNSEVLEAYILEITQRFGTHDAHHVLMQFLCHCLPLIRKFLPPAGREALQTAQDYWLDAKGQPHDLNVARENCWNYLDARGKTVEVADREDAAMRALICVLFPEPTSEDFTADTVRWFASMIERIGDFTDEIRSLMNV